MKVIRNLYPSQVIIRQAPEYNPEVNNRLFSENGLIYHQPNSNIVEASNIFITSDGIPFRFFRFYKKFITCYHLDFKKSKWKYLLSNYLKRKTIVAPSNTKGYILAFDNYSGPKGFAHWLCDMIPKLVEAKEYLQANTLVIPYYFLQEKIYTDTLSFFKAREFYVIEKNTKVKFDKIKLIEPIADSGNFNPENIEKIRNTFIPSEGQNNYLSEYCNIYISRKKASRRHLTNENEILPILEKHQYKIVYMEDHSLVEQIKMMSNAKNVISIHGAALSLIMFMKKGASVLELRKEKDEINGIYFNLASAAGLNYFYLPCRGNVISPNANNFDLSADPSELDQLISLYLN